MPPILVRHASAGDRSAWDGAEGERPLDDRGRKQALELVARLAPFPISAIYSSSALRCIQTVQPLAAARDLPVVTLEELGEARHATAGRLLAELVTKDVVVCGHRGLEQAVRKPRKWRKGAAFVLDEKLRIVDEV